MGDVLNGKPLWSIEVEWTLLDAYGEERRCFRRTPPSHIRLAQPKDQLKTQGLRHCLTHSAEIPLPSDRCLLVIASSARSRQGRASDSARVASIDIKRGITWNIGFDIFDRDNQNLKGLQEVCTLTQRNLSPAVKANANEVHQD